MGKSNQVFSTTNKHPNHLASPGNSIIQQVLPASHSLSPCCAQRCASWAPPPRTSCSTQSSGQSSACVVGERRRRSTSGTTAGRNSWPTCCRSTHCNTGHAHGDGPTQGRLHLIQRKESHYSEEAIKMQHIHSNLEIVHKILFLSIPNTPGTRKTCLDKQVMLHEIRQ